MQNQILILDQDQVFSDLLGQLLQSQGYDVVTSKVGAVDPKDGKGIDPALVILNLMRPDGEAAGVCRSMRAASDVPVLALSPINDPNVIAGLLDAGADDHLVKPVAGGVLIAHVRKLMRRNGSLETAVRLIQPLARAQTQPLQP